MRFWPIVAIGILVGVMGCDDASSPLAPSTVVPIEPVSTYVSAHRGRCPSDSELPFDIRDNGWYWVDRCQNNFGETVQLSDWCSGTRRVVGDSCVAIGNGPQPPVETTTLSVTGPTTVQDNACVQYHVTGGTAPYRLASAGGRWVTSEPCASTTPTRYTLTGPGGAIWSGTGLDPGDSAQVTVTDADGAHTTITIFVV